MAGIVDGAWKLIQTIAGFIANHKGAIACALIGAILFGVGGPFTAFVIGLFGGAIIGEMLSRCFFSGKDKIEPQMTNVNRQGQEPTRSNDMLNMNQEIDDSTSDMELEDLNSLDELKDASTTEEVDAMPKEIDKASTTEEFDAQLKK